ncbi:potassium voltage-gated channel subfamily C member 3-like [Gigantopelta aegis]|uniref:potassium voltage-gated channel subfamily C member 3-like n=1 Tax=Gigantopelta aegis TaxID=1735272 RepID=UPI001B88B146|nr:potassium voltage-gated channel subfamily C member 3-like [Gigantopelta aegis]
MGKEKMVKLVVGGMTFSTKLETLRTRPNTLLASLDNTSEFYDRETDAFVFDRDSHVFSFILNFYRSSELQLPSGICGNAIRNELQFWQIPECHISECCWRVMHKADKDKILFNNLRQRVDLESKIPEVTSSSGRLRIWRHRLFFILEHPNSPPRLVWNFFYMVLVFTSAVLLTLSSQPELRQRYYLVDDYNFTKLYTKDSSAHKYDLYAYYGLVPSLYILDNILVAIFTLELAVRFLVHYHKRLFFRSILNWIDIVCTLAGFGTVVMDLLLTYGVFHQTSEVYWGYLVLQCSMVFRLLKFFRLQERYVGLRIMFLTIQGIAKDLLMLLLCFVILSVIFGTLQYYCEFENQKFSTVPLSIWWSIITMTTVGYGDYYPESVCGYFMGTVCYMFGIIFFSIPIALIAANFNDYYTRIQQRELFAKKEKELLVFKMGQALPD